MQPPAGGCSARPASAIPARLREPMEDYFGRSFRAVRLHTGREAHASAEAAGAIAFTVGDDIVLGASAPALDSREGRRLLAHELTHVAQQEGAPGIGLAGGAPLRRLARQADGAPEEEQGEVAEAVPEVSGEGEVEEVVAMANVSLPGRTNASFSSAFSTSNQTTSPGAGGCQVVTGTMNHTFTVATTVTLPAVPAGLTPCQAANAQRFISSILSPHEQQHVAAFQTFNGSSSTSFTLTVCPGGQSLSAQAQALHNTERQARQAQAQALSDALDPFNVDVDIDAGCAPAAAPPTPTP